ncbi:MAG: BREX system Lon protease-like protein BrxL [Acidobacteriota bacterium]|nr:BREX system Lon protease-like protein BrxL [Acidobacteriota bacterium]
MSVELNQKVREVFGPLAMDKRRLSSSGLTKSGIPAYVAEWVLEEIVPGEGALTDEERATLERFTEQMIPRRNEQNVYRHRLLMGDIVPLLAYMNVEVSLSRSKQERFVNIQALGFNDCWVADALVEKNKDLLRQGMWGIIELIGTKDGVQVAGFEPMQASVDLKQFYEKRREFNADEWRELMLTSAGYNPAAYSINEQIMILCRLLPLVQKNLHLMELAPKGTGKSHIYINISPRVYLTSGNLSPAVLFFNNATDQPGLLARYDVIVIDEVQKLRLENPYEIISNLKIYLENDTIRRGGKVEIPSDCALVILANIPLSENQQPDSELVVGSLPEFMRETAFLDRFRGIIPGWLIPKFQQEGIASGVGLKADFFSDTLTAMRHDTRHEEWVRSRVTFKNTGIRDQRAITGIASGLLKILYPDICLTPDTFRNYCLNPAIQLRQIVRNQLWHLDSEYRQTDKQLCANVAEW